MFNKEKIKDLQWEMHNRKDCEERLRSELRSLEDRIGLIAGHLGLEFEERPPQTVLVDKKQ